MSSARSGPWLVAVAAVAVATGVVVGQLARGGTDAAAPPKGPGPSFQLGQAERPQPGSTGNPAPGELGIMPVMGPIRSVDTGSGAVTVGGQGEIPVQRVRVTPQTLIVRQAPGGAADFKVGDTIVASGAPKELIVREARALQLSPGALQRTGGEGNAGLSALLGAPIGAGGGGFARVQGKVTSLSPLKIALNEGIECTLTLAPGASVARIVEATLADLRPGEMLIGGAQVGADGSLTALQLGVGFQLPFGPGGFPGAGGPGAGLRRRFRGAVR